MALDPNATSTTLPSESPPGFRCTRCPQPIGAGQAYSFDGDGKPPGQAHVSCLLADGRELRTLVKKLWTFFDHPLAYTVGQGRVHCKSCTGSGARVDDVVHRDGCWVARAKEIATR